MRRSKCEIYLHFVWATKGRRPWINARIEREVYRCIESEVQKLNGVVLALNGMPDHVHLVVQMPSTLNAAQLAKQVKGVSSAFINDHDRLPVDDLFRWQEGYGVFSVSRSHLRRVMNYVQGQKQHHENGTTWPQWEETDQEAP